MELREKKGICIIFAVIALAVLSVLAARLFLGVDIFDRSGWRADEDGAYRYLDYHGKPLLGWQEIDGKLYYFRPDQQGEMAVGWLETEDGRYFLQSDGQKRLGWHNLDGARYYFDEDGRMRTGWLATQDGRYYLSETGAVAAGWADTDEGRYYIAEDGSACTGWLSLDGDTFFLDQNGRMLTGWLDWEGERYYFRPDGRMAVGKVSVDGTDHYFTSQGKYIVLVNRWNPVPEDYATELVPFEEFLISADCRDALEELIGACKAAGLPCRMTSGFRGYDYQNSLFQRKVNTLMASGYSRAAAEEETARSIAIPGTSEHQLGLAVDLKNTYGTYQWLAENSWKYGFIMRYPYGDTALTGIYYEPWHFRYVGEELAAELYELDICLEAYMDLLTADAE